MDGYDYIVVGAGSSGAALAARLSEDETTTVLLLEAGGRDGHPWLRIPIGYGKAFYDARFNWKYTTEPDPNLGGRRMYWPRGRVLGGSSSINAMVYVRGHRADFDEWAVTAPGWGWADVEPVFRRMENWRGPSDPARGTQGPLSVTDVSHAVHPLTRAYIAAAGQAGIPWNADYNAARMTGACCYQITTSKGQRASTARAYLVPAQHRPNLRIATGALAHCIRFDNRRAAGVEYGQQGQMITAHARREVILCAGAINTPQLLQLSGVGPGDLLQSHGIEVVQDAPKVGQNLMDHLGVDLTFAAQVPSLNQVLRPLWGKARVGLQYLLARNGPISMSLNQGGGFVRFGAADTPPDMQLYFSPLSYSRAPEGVRPLMSPDPFPAFRFGFSPCKPTSTGHIAIRSPDPTEAPSMHPNYLATREDCAMMVTGTRLLRRIASMPALKVVTGSELLPGPEMQSDDDMIANARADGWTVFHQCGTCRMGQDPAASVVDPRLRVHGLSGLRVADASIFPTIPSGNINAPAIMVGEKASDIIREDART